MHVLIVLWLSVFIQSLAEKKRKFQEDVTRLEAEGQELRANHDVSVPVTDKRTSFFSKSGRYCL